VNAEPALQATLGADWDQLAPVVRRHHRLRTHSHDRLDLTGTMQRVWHSRWLDPFLPLMGWMDAIVPYIGSDVPALVRCQADPKCARVYWQREFRFADGRLGTFRSFKEFSGDHEVCEVIRGGIAARLQVSVHAGGLSFDTRSFEWRFAGCALGLPLEWLIGRIRCEEIPLSDERIRIIITFNHRWLGCLVCYDGEFEVP